MQMLKNQQNVVSSIENRKPRQFTENRVKNSKGKLQNQFVCKEQFCLQNALLGKAKFLG